MPRILLMFDQFLEECSTVMITALSQIVKFNSFEILLPPAFIFMTNFQNI